MSTEFSHILWTLLDITKGVSSLLKWHTACYFCQEVFIIFQLIISVIGIIKNYDREHSGIKSCALEQWKKICSLEHVNNTVCPCIHTKYSNLLHRFLHIIVAEKHHNIAHVYRNWRNLFPSPLPLLSREGRIILRSITTTKFSESFLSFLSYKSSIWPNYMWVIFQLAKVHISKYMFI